MNSIVDTIKRVFGLSPARRQEPTPAQQPVEAPRPAVETTLPPVLQADEAAQVPVVEAAMATAPPQEAAAESVPAAEARPDASSALVEEVAAVAAPSASASAEESAPDAVATPVEAELSAAAEAPMEAEAPAAETPMESVSEAIEAPMEPTPLVAEVLDEPAEPAEPPEAFVEFMAVEAGPLAWENAAEAEAAPAGVDAIGESASTAFPFESPAEASADILVAEQVVSDVPLELQQPTADIEVALPTADIAAADAEAEDAEPKGADEQAEFIVPPEIPQPATKPVWPEEPRAARLMASCPAHRANAWCRE
jgi:hypothetical protein